jgi:hypothetical protein
MVKRNDAYTVCALARATREPVENYKVTLVRWKPNVGSQDQQFIPSKHEYGSYLDVLLGRKARLVARLPAYGGQADMNDL